MADQPARYGSDEVAKCLEREVKLRKRLYPGRVRNHRMTQAAADREIALMQQVLDDYRRQIGDLFETVDVLKDSG